MKKSRLLLLLFALMLILTGCGSGNSGDYTGKPYITGYVVAKGEGDNGLLVVSPEDEERGDGTENRIDYDALWAYDSPEEADIGEQVRVWVEDGEVEESYPGQAAAGKVEIIPAGMPEGATLSEAEALNKALTENEFSDAVLSVQELSYDPDQASWTIRLIGGMSNEEYTVQVEDSETGDLGVRNMGHSKS